MKLRIFNNSLRLRLRKSDLEQLSQQGNVEGALHFGGGSAFRYALVTVPDAPAIFARLADNAIEIRIPSEAALHWASSDEVGLSAEQHTGEGAPLTILIEKDWQCLHKNEPGDEDAYPNPDAAISH